MRDFSILGTIVVVSILLGAGLYLFGGPAFHGASAQSPGASSPVKFTVLETGDNAPAVNQRVNYLITSNDELAQLWQMVYGNNGPEIPQVDFSTKNVIAVFDGSHSESGYSIIVTRIEDIAGKRVVTVDRIAPPATCTNNADASSPFQIVSMPKSDLPLDHADISVRGTSCSN